MAEKLVAPVTVAKVRSCRAYITQGLASHIADSRPFTRSLNRMLAMADENAPGSLLYAIEAWQEMEEACLLAISNSQVANDHQKVAMKTVFSRCAADRRAMWCSGYHQAGHLLTLPHILTGSLQASKVQRPIWETIYCPTNTREKTYF
eukprot:9806603-Karenia_brevis.AAC.1